MKNENILAGGEHAKEWMAYIKASRIKNGITLEFINNETGIDRSLISRWESGERIPRLDQFVLYLRAMELNMIIKHDKEL